MKTKLHIGHTTKGKLFSFPLEAATQTFSILAKRGVGKTYTAAVIQAATYLYHDVKAKCMTALIFGVRRAFVGELLLPEHHCTVGELELPELSKRIPKMLVAKRR